MHLPFFSRQRARKWLLSLRVIHAVNLWRIGSQKGGKRPSFRLTKRRKAVRKMRLNWVGPVFSALGYARHNREMVKVLGAQKCEISLNPSSPPDGPNLKGLDSYLMQEFFPDAPTVVCVPAPPCRHDDGYDILFTTVESLLPHPGLVHRSDQFDEIWVPSHLCRAGFRTMGVKRKKVWVIPEGIDPIYWQKSCPSRTDRFVFITLADWSFRKGVHFLLQAYTRSFTVPQRVELILLTRYATKTDAPSVHRIKEEASGSVGFDIETRPDIRFITNELTDGQIRNLFSSAHVFVLPTLGEAWCLPACEAMACGLPCILPECGGHREFHDEQTGWLTKGSWKNSREFNESEVDFYRGQTFFFPDVDNVARAMRTAYDDLALCRRKGLVAMHRVHTQYRWEDAALIAYDRLLEIQKKGWTPHKPGALI